MLQCLAVLLICGCGKKNDLVGTWSMQPDPKLEEMVKKLGSTGATKFELDIKDDGTYVMKNVIGGRAGRGPPGGGAAPGACAARAK